jgi:hypothetical protein
MLVEAMTWAIGSCVHASVILAVALAVTLTMRRACASTRHWMWSCAVVAALLLPLLTTFFPEWEVGPVAGLERIASVASFANRAASDDVIDTTGERAQRTRAAPPVVASSDIDHAWLLAVLWASGTLGILLYAFLGILAVRRIRRST